MNIKTLNNRRGSVTVETAIVFPLLLVLIALFAVVIKDNIQRSLVNHLAVSKSVKECFGTTVNQVRVDISNLELEWMGGQNIKTKKEVNNDVLTVVATTQTNINIPMIGRMKKTNESKIYVPIFNDIFGDNSGGDGGSVWDLMPFDRGKVIENIFGNNLPDKFEVLDILTSDGEGTSIMSIDTTAQTYANDGMLYEKIVERIDRLAYFQGDEDGEVKVDAGDIKTRKLLVIIPSNGLTDMQSAQVVRAEEYAASRGIAFEIVEYQEKVVG